MENEIHMTNKTYSSAVLKQRFMNVTNLRISTMMVHVALTAITQTPGPPFTNMV